MYVLRVLNVNNEDGGQLSFTAIWHAVRKLAMRKARGALRRRLLC